jgi:hypothetical protein
MRTFLLLSVLLGPCCRLNAQKFTAFNVYFKTGSAELSAAEKTKIDSVLATIKDGTTFDIKATGHADKRGSFRFNENLSQRRAEMVVSYIHHKIKNGHINAQGKSFSEMAYVGDDINKFEKNRRVLIELSYSIPEIKSLGNETLQTEMFIINASVDDSIVTKSGTVIHIPATIFQTASGRDVAGKVTIEYTEYRDAVDFILGGISMGHVEDGKPYIFNSSGMFTIKGSQEKNEILIKPGKKISIDFARTQVIDSTNFYNYNTENKSWNTLQAIDQKELPNATITQGNAVVVNNQFARNQHEDAIKASCVFNSCNGLDFIGNTALTIIDKKMPVYKSILKKNKYREYDVKKLNSRYEKLDRKTRQLQKTIDSASHELNLLRSVYKIKRVAINGNVFSFTLGCDSGSYNQFKGMENVVWEYTLSMHKQLDLYMNTGLEYCAVNNIDAKGETTIEMALVSNKRIKLRHVKLAKQTDAATRKNMNAIFRNYIHDYKSKKNTIRKLMDLRNRKEFQAGNYYRSMDSIEAYFKAPFEAPMRDTLACFYDRSLPYMTDRNEKKMFELLWFNYFEKNEGTMQERYTEILSDKVMGDTCRAVKIREDRLAAQMDFNNAAEFRFKNMKTALGISSFGIYNCDQLQQLVNPEPVLATYTDENHENIEIKSVFMIDHSINSVLVFNGYLDLWPRKFSYSKNSDNSLVAFDEKGEPYLCTVNAFASAVNAPGSTKTFMLQKINKQTTKKEILAGTQ